MRYKEDWEKAKARFEAFWNHEIVDRCCISVTSCDWAKVGDVNRIVPDLIGRIKEEQACTAK